MSSENSSARLRKTPIYGLDAVRFLAAILVVVYHLAFKAWAIKDSTLNLLIGRVVDYPPAWWISWSGWIGVQVFFVVSGAVIAYSMQGVDARTFAVRRIARLLPAVLVCVAIAVPISILAFGVSPRSALWLATKTLVFAPMGPWIMGQFWTIPIELAFYGVIFLLLAWKGSDRGATYLPWALGLASAAYWTAAELGLMQPGGRITELLLFQHGGYFAIGMLCSRLSSGGLNARQFLLAALCVASAAVQIRTIAGWEMDTRPDLAAYWLTPFGIWVVMTALIALSFRFRDQVAHRVVRWSSTLRMAGLCTYPLYLVHIHVGGAVLLMATPLGITVSFLFALVASLAASIVIAAWLEPRVHSVIKPVLDGLAHRIAPAVR